MDDRELLHTIEKLVSEEHELMQEAEEGQLDDTKHSRMREIEVRLVNAGTSYVNAAPAGNLASVRTRPRCAIQEPLSTTSSNQHA